MRHIVGRALWIGNAGDLSNPTACLAAGVEAVVELADSEPMAALPRGLVRFRFPLSDGGENPKWLIRSAVQSVATLIIADVPTLICCRNGLNRSVCVAAAALAYVEHRPMMEMLLSVVESGPVDIAPGLLAQFLDLKTQ